MRKITFIKLCSAAMTMPLESWASPEKLTNWAGNIEYSTGNVHGATSVEDVQRFVRAHNKFKTLGTRHCFNRIADSATQLLTTPFASGDPVLDENARTISVGPGVRYGTIAPILESKGFALHNLASLPHISVAGACATATHGSGANNGNLATAVAALEFVNASGDLVKLSRQQDRETFQGAVVGLGAVGVITKLTLDIQPTFMMRQYVYENLPLNEVKE